MKQEYIIVIMRDTNQILYGGYDHPRAHKIATAFADTGKAVRKIYKEIPDYLRHSLDGKDPADWWEFGTGKGNGINGSCKGRTTYKQ